MGRQESLAALALGRGHYDDEVIRNAGESSSVAQQYNDRGHPRNPETKRREREHVRAANEVMQVTGVVEDAFAAIEKAAEQRVAKNHETAIGLRLMDVCRTTFIGGTWGVIGLRRRILLYQPYAQNRTLGLLQQERVRHSISHIAFAGLPATLTHHALDWISVFVNAVLDAINEEDDNANSEEKSNTVLQTCLDYGFRYVGFHLQLFATLQQLNLIPATRMLPSLKSLLLFSSESPFQLPPNPSFSSSWGGELLQMALPFFVVFCYNNIRTRVSNLTYRPIYKSIPRPTGDIMVQDDDSGRTFYNIDTNTTTGEPNVAREGHDERARTSDEPVEIVERRGPDREIQEASDDEEDELAHATLISFDVEPTEGPESVAGPWSAELRSANEPKPSDGVKYRVTGLTMLPAIMATEATRDIVTDILVMPCEAAMLRVLATTYRRSAGLGIDDLWPMGLHIDLSSAMNLLTVVGTQFFVSGIILAGFTIGTQAWLHRVRLQEWFWRKNQVFEYRFYSLVSGLLPTVDR